MRCRSIGLVLGCLLFEVLATGLAQECPIVFREGGRVPVGSEPRGIVASDFDADGVIDLATANSSDASITILLTRDGAYRFESVTLEGVRNSSSLSAGDFDGDASPDIAIAANGVVTILLSDGPLQFSVAGEVEVDGAIDLESVDFDNDGDLDIAVAQYDAHSVSVLLNSGSGTFENSIEKAAGAFPVCIVADDLDGDGHVDLASANSNSFDVSVFYGDGDGSLLDAQSVRVGRRPRGVCIADLDGDGLRDLAVTADFDRHVGRG